jgi:alanine racemase
MKPYTIKSIAAIIQAEVLQMHDDAVVKNIVLDSRKITEASVAVFFAIKGKRHDGHAYIKELYDKGIKNFIVNEALNIAAFPKANILKVKNTVKALQALAVYHRKQFQMPVIGITGSNGKTIIKEWLYQLLSDDYTIVRSPKSYNSQVGVPLSVWQMNDEHQLGIFEAGISEPDEMSALQKVIQPEIGVFTNIGDAHAEGFLNIKHKISEKLNLFSNSKVLIYRKDYTEISACIAAIKNQLLKHEDEAGEKFPLFTWSTQGEANLQIKQIQKHIGTTTISGTYQEQPYSIEIPFIDDASIENIINCWCVLLYLKVPHEKIQERMMKLGKVAMRLEMKAAINNCTLINDSYNSDIASLSIALDFLEQQSQHDNKTVILSDILQSGKSAPDLYNEVSQMISRKGIKRFFGIGKSLAKQQSLFEKIPHLEAHFFESTEDFLNHFATLNFSSEIILLKGARAFEFEAIAKLLEEKRHATVLEVNLNAIAHNLNEYHKLLQPGVKMMAMVKASSYGSGGYEIAKTLQYNRVDYLGVAYADEGVELRKAGITLPIMVMNPEERSFEAMINFRLEPEIYSLHLLKKFARAFESFKKTIEHHDFPIHIDLETGMNRLGFAECDIDEMLATLQEHPHLKIQSIFSHLAASEDAKEDVYTKQQIADFERMSKTIIDAISYKPLLHILNSAGIARFPEAQYNMVRLGLGLYGIDSATLPQLKLQTVGKLKSTISQIKPIKKGETIGYNRSFKATKNMTIATISIGYADGIDRRLSNGKGSVLIHNKLAPIVGKVCMDMTMIDITNITETKEGDEAIIFNETLTIQKVAEWAGTIPYEILTGISSRVQRVFFQE